MIFIKAVQFELLFFYIYVIKLTGKIFISCSLIILTIIFFVAAVFNLEANFIFWMVGSVSFVAFFLGIAFLFLNAQPKIREKFVKIASFILLTLIILVFLFKHFYWSGVSILYLSTGSFLAFSILPVYTKNRIEKWKQYTSKSWHAYLLSFGDLISVTALILGYMFKKFHWPGANIMMSTGMILLAICLVFWNRLFSKEIILRKKAEQEAELRLIEIEKQKYVIEVKNEEIISSIRYARKIQNSLMPSQKYLEKILKSNFESKT